MNTGGTLRMQLPTVQTHQSAQGGTCVGNCGDHFGVQIPLSAAWAEVSFTWSELEQNGSGRVTMLELKDVLSIEFSVNRDVEFDFWVDQIAFY